MKPLVAVSYRPSIPASPDAEIDRHLGEGFRASDMRRFADRLERHYTRPGDTAFLEGFRIVALSGSDGFQPQTRVEMLRVPGAWRLVDVQLPVEIVAQREQVRLVAPRRYLLIDTLPAWCRKRGWLHPDEHIDLRPRTWERRDREKGEVADREDESAFRDLLV